MDSVRIRLMTPDDLPAAQRASDAAFLEADRMYRRWNEPEPEPLDEAAARAWVEGIGHHVATDPCGCWVAEADGGEIVGLAVAQNRGGVWYLAVFSVLPGLQGKGVGRRLFDAALAHAGDRPGLISSSPHPAATRRYRLAGFALHPLMSMTGRVDRSVLPAIDGLREGRPDDFEWMDALDVTLRGGPHGADHPHMLERRRLIVSSSPGERPGYVYLDKDEGNPILLAAAQVETAERLLWEALAHTRQKAVISHITAGNLWAIDIGLAARLDLGRDGYLALRGISEPVPYLASRHHL